MTDTGVLAGDFFCLHFWHAVGVLVTFCFFMLCLVSCYSLIFYNTDAT